MMTDDLFEMRGITAEYRTLFVRPLVIRGDFMVS